MHYEIHDSKGNVIAATDDWSRLMQLYKDAHKREPEAVTLHKIEDESEVEQ